MDVGTALCPAKCSETTFYLIRIFRYHHTFQHSIQQRAPTFGERHNLTTLCPSKHTSIITGMEV